MGEEQILFLNKLNEWVGPYEQVELIIVNFLSHPSIAPTPTF